MDKETFYGTGESKTISYLEFGSIDLSLSKKDVWDFRLHEKAYDWLMCARYANDMVTYIDMKEKLGHLSLTELARLYRGGVHHRGDISGNLGKLCALAVMNNSLEKNKQPSFYELGQTLFGCIEGMEFCREFLKHLGVRFPSLDLKKVDWYGVDISHLFNRLAIMLHCQYHVTTLEDTSRLPSRMDVFFAKGVTLLYAVRSVRQLLDILDRARLSVFDYSFSMKGEQETSIGTGKLVKYLDFGSYQRKYRQGNKKMFARKNKSKYDAATNRVFLDCVYGEEDLCRDFIGLDKRVRRELVAKLSSGGDGSVLSDLLDITPGDNLEWVELGEFVKSLK